MAFSTSGYDVKYEIEGKDELIKLFRQMPLRISKRVMVNTLKKGGRVIIGDIKGHIPSEIKGAGAALDISVIGKDQEMPSILVGFHKRKKYFSNKSGKGRQGDLRAKKEAGRKFDAATIAYWFNYGTYGNRTGGYKFRTARKAGSAGRRGGIHAGLFLQRGVVTGMRKANETITKDFDSIITKELEKLAVK